MSVANIVQQALDHPTASSRESWAAFNDVTKESSVPGLGILVFVWKSTLRLNPDKTHGVQCGPSPVSSIFLGHSPLKTRSCVTTAPHPGCTKNFAQAR